jgi:hypothetical protein
MWKREHRACWACGKLIWCGMRVGGCDINLPRCRCGCDRTVQIYPGEVVMTGEERDGLGES